MAYPKAYKLAKKKAITKKRKVTKKHKVTKKRSAKQIAATKRLVAFNKKRRSKKTTVKRKPVRRTNPRKNVTSKKRYVLCVVPSAAGLNSGIDPKTTGFWTGTGWDTRKDKAVRYPSIQAIKNEVAHLPVKYRSGKDWSYATDTV